MVLKNSKWDKKAKYDYLKKHNLLKKNKNIEEENKPKWSSKKESDAPNSLMFNDSDSEYDTEEDEAFLSQFFPQIGEAELTKQQKQKIKLQLLQDLQDQNRSDDEIESQELDSIYLGSEEKRFQDLENRLEECKLEDYISSEIPTGSRNVNKNRKLLKSKESKGLFEEYGISYADTVRKEDDYNGAIFAKQRDRKLDDISTEELIGFKVGESTFDRTEHEKKPQMKVLEGEDLEENKKRLEKANQDKLLRQIKSKFGESNGNKNHKILEINNFNNQDERLLENLKAKIKKHSSDTRNEISSLDDDIKELLGEAPSTESASLRTVDNDVEDLLNSLENGNPLAQVNNKGIQPTSAKQSIFIPKPAESDQAFLDDLLG